jgi:hypothetical protein
MAGFFYSVSNYYRTVFLFGGVQTKETETEDQIAGIKTCECGFKIEW